VAIDRPKASAINCLFDIIVVVVPAATETRDTPLREAACSARSEERSRRPSPLPLPQHPDARDALRGGLFSSPTCCEVTAGDRCEVMTCPVRQVLTGNAHTHDGEREMRMMPAGAARNTGSGVYSKVITSFQSPEPVWRCRWRWRWWTD